MTDQCQAAQVLPSTRAWRIRRFFIVRLQMAYDVLRMLFLRLCYRHLMRLTHYFGWHYAPIRGPFPDGESYRWCQWCGMRGTIPNYRKLIAELNAEAYPQSAASHADNKDGK